MNQQKKVMYFPIDQSDDLVKISVGCLPHNPELILNLLRMELVPLDLWITTALEYYRQSKIKVTHIKEDTSVTITPYNIRYLEGLNKACHVLEAGLDPELENVPEYESQLKQMQSIMHEKLLFIEMTLYLFSNNNNNNKQISQEDFFRKAKCHLLRAVDNNNNNNNNISRKYLLRGWFKLQLFLNGIIKRSKYSNNNNNNNNNNNFLDSIIKDLEKFITIYNNSIDNSIDYNRSLLLLALTFLLSSNYNKALIYYRKVLVNCSSLCLMSQQCRLGIAYCQLKRGNLMKALQAAKRCLDLDKTNMDALFIYQTIRDYLDTFLNTEIKINKKVYENCNLNRDGNLLKNLGYRLNRVINSVIKESVLPHNLLKEVSYLKSLLIGKCGTDISIILNLLEAQFLESNGELIRSIECYKEVQIMCFNKTPSINGNDGNIFVGSYALIRSLFLLSYDENPINKKLLYKSNKIRAKYITHDNAISLARLLLFSIKENKEDRRNVLETTGIFLDHAESQLKEDSIYFDNILNINIRGLTVNEYMNYSQSNKDPTFLLSYLGSKVELHELQAFYSLFISSSHLSGLRDQDHKYRISCVSLALASIDDMKRILSIAIGIEFNINNSFNLLNNSFNLKFDLKLEKDKEKEKERTTLLNKFVFVDRKGKKFSLKMFIRRITVTELRLRIFLLSIECNTKKVRKFSVDEEYFHLFSTIKLMTDLLKEINNNNININNNNNINNKLPTDKGDERYLISTAIIFIYNLAIMFETVIWVPPSNSISMLFELFILLKKILEYSSIEYNNNNNNKSIPKIPCRGFIISRYIYMLIIDLCGLPESIVRLHYLNGWRPIDDENILQKEENNIQNTDSLSKDILRDYFFNYNLKLNNKDNNNLNNKDNNNLKETLIINFLEKFEGVYPLHLSLLPSSLFISHIASLCLEKAFEVQGGNYLISHRNRIWIDRALVLYLAALAPNSFICEDIEPFISQYLNTNKNTNTNKNKNNYKEAVDISKIEKQKQKQNNKYFIPSIRGIATCYLSIGLTKYSEHLFRTSQEHGAKTWRLCVHLGSLYMNDYMNIDNLQCNKMDNNKVNNKGVATVNNDTMDIQSLRILTKTSTLFELALVMYKESHYQCSESHTDIQMCLSKSLYEQERFDECIEILEECLLRKPESLEIRLSLSLVLELVAAKRITIQLKVMASRVALPDAVQQALSMVYMALAYFRHLESIASITPPHLVSEGIRRRLYDNTACKDINNNNNKSKIPINDKSKVPINDKDKEYPVSKNLLQHVPYLQATARKCESWITMLLMKRKSHIQEQIRIDKERLFSMEKEAKQIHDKQLENEYKERMLADASQEKLLLFRLSMAGSSLKNVEKNRKGIDEQNKISKQKSKKVKRSETFDFNDENNENINFEENNLNKEEEIMEVDPDVILGVNEKEKEKEKENVIILSSDDKQNVTQIVSPDFINKTKDDEKCYTTNENELTSDDDELLDGLFGD